MQSENRGIMPRSFEYIFYNLNRLEKEGDFEYLVKCSYLEIYNENIQDLLDPSTQVLKLREDIQKGVYVVGAIEENVRSTAQMNEIIKKGTLNRHISCTEMNKDSSRSHAVMTLKIETKKLQEGVSKITTSSFHIIDLAGSERAKRTGAGGIILKEAGSINKSLSILGNVINCLVEIDQGKKRFVHYRDSKLTYLLKNSLGGNAKTLMIANISPASCSYFETNSTLKFAQRAKMIKNDAVINEDSSANVAQLKNEIRKLKVKIHDLELEKASWQCDLGEEEPKYRSPGTKNRVSEALSEKKALNQHLGNQPRMQFQTFSPSMVSELGPEEATGDAKLVRRVKKLQNLVKLHLEQSIQKDKLYEQEIDKKDVHISKLETTIEEYDKISKKDQMLISSRDKTIAQLKNSSGINLEDFRNHQIDLLKEEKELLEYKISNNPELEGFKSKCSKLKNQIEEMKGD